MSNIDFDEPEATNIVENGIRIHSMRFHPDEPMTVGDVARYLREYEEDGENPYDGYSFKVTVNFPNEGWRTRTDWITVDDLVQGGDQAFWENYEDQVTDQDTRQFSEFMLLIKPREMPDAGGDDLHNDCLFNAICRGFPLNKVKFYNKTTRSYAVLEPEGLK